MVFLVSASRGTGRNWRRIGGRAVHKPTPQRLNGSRRQARAKKSLALDEEDDRSKPDDGIGRTCRQESHSHARPSPDLTGIGGNRGREKRRDDRRQYVHTRSDLSAGAAHTERGVLAGVGPARIVFIRRVADDRCGAALAWAGLHAAQLHACAAVNIRTEHKASAQCGTPESEGQQAGPNQYGDNGASHGVGPIVALSRGACPGWRTG